MKILIAEDDYTSRTILTGVLRAGGHEVIQTENGVEAWEKLQQPGAPRLVILDWMMPEMDGMEVLGRVRSMPTDCPPYIIMLTTRSGPDEIVAGLKLGANDYVTKPVEAAEILARVEVGQRSIDQELVQHRLRVNAQNYRVHASAQIAELQNALAAKDKELRHAQAAFRMLESRMLAGY
ncbi:MAG: hypothetical protein RLZZ282_408 [Verrucomicrobiota bacterium]